MSADKKENEKDALALGLLAEFTIEVKRRVEDKSLYTDLKKMPLEKLLGHIKAFLTAAKLTSGDEARDFPRLADPEKMRLNSPTKKTEHQRKLAHTRADKARKSDGEPKAVQFG